MDLPEPVRRVLTRLETGGYEAWVVGGCVRDALMGREPTDYDIATAAPPQETLRLFADTPVIETGLRHGTVTVLMGSMPLEVTTYRVDGEYRDSRRPESVRFVADLREDLSRRDFTMNALAYREPAGLRDEFGGEEDVRRGLVRCVGEPRHRFEEDALRILRALRFASTLGFAIEEGTRAALLREKERLSLIAAERLMQELRRLLCGRGAKDVLWEYGEILSVFLPELLPLWQRRALWKQMTLRVENVPPDPSLRLAALFYDVGVPAARAGESPAQKGAALTEAVARRLKWDTSARKTVCRLVASREMPLLPLSRSQVRRWLCEWGRGALRISAGCAGLS